MRQARANRIRLPQYLRLDGGRYLIAAALALSLLSLITLGQTGRLATKGYEIGQLQKYRTELLREQSKLNLRISEAQSLAKIEQRAQQQGLRPAMPDQIRYLTVAPLVQAPPASEAIPPAEAAPPVEVAPPVEAPATEAAPTEAPVATQVP